MLAKVKSAALSGLDCIPVEVEVDVSDRGLPSFKIVGLPGKAVSEAKVRVRTAIKNSGLFFPDHKITINLTPADLPKQGPAYDLPIALGILIASGQIKANIANALVLGELSIDGSLRHTKGVLPLALLARSKKCSQIFLPKSNAQEAAVIKGLTIFPVDTLSQLLFHFHKIEEIKPHKHKPFNNFKKDSSFAFEMQDIIGQEQAKRALEIAAAGGHNVFMIGPPGAGKTMLARTLPSIMPELTEKEALEVTKIYSVCGNIPSGKSLITKRPFRSPHHTISRIGLVGGGSKPMPGEITLAHRGVLFLDEFPEFPHHVLESLRQPLEDGIIQVSRAKGTAFFPSKLCLVAASNPCPCGFYGSKKRSCTCSSGQIVRYRKRISGPILDRIDIHLSVPEVNVDKLIGKSSNIKRESSKTIRTRVQLARIIQLKRFKKLSLSIFSNAEMANKQVKKLCPLSTDCLQLIKQAMEKLNLSARVYFKIIKIARTIADLASEQNIKLFHIAEAIQYCPREEEM